MSTFTFSQFNDYAASSNDDEREMQKTQKRKIARLILEDTALNITSRLRLADIANQTTEHLIEGEGLKDIVLAELKQGRATLCAVFCRKFPGVGNIHFFACYFIPFSASGEMRALQSKLTSDLEAIARPQQHVPKTGIWVTVEGLPQVDDKMYMYAPAQMIYDDINRQLDRFNEGQDFRDNSPANCILDITGAAEYDLQWIGKVTQIHKENLIKQFSHSNFIEMPDKSTWLEPKTSQATPTADYGMFSNNCGTAIKYLAGIERAKTWSSATCALLGFKGVKGNLLNKVTTMPTTENYIDLLHGAQ